MKIISLCVLFSLTIICSAAPKKKKVDAEIQTDRIDVVGHIPVEGAVTNLISAIHLRQAYVYVQHGEDRKVMVVDVTNPAAPRKFQDLAMPNDVTEGQLDEVNGTAALVSTQPKAATSQTVTIVSFANPAQPRVVRKFANVSFIVKENSRSLIYLANDEGLWILKRTFAPDKELEESYGHYVIYQ